MTTLHEINKYIDEIAPYCLAEEWDNCGLLIDGGRHEITRVLVALDVTDRVIGQAIENSVQLIISHHPILFTPLRKLAADLPAVRLAASGISVLCAHTNLDAADGGVNDVLAARLELINVRGFPAPVIPASEPESPGSIGRIGDTPAPSSPEALAAQIKKALGCNHVRYTDTAKQISRVVVCAGAGGVLVPDILSQQPDALITGELKYHDMQALEQAGICLLEAGHFHTERIMIPELVNRLANRFRQVEFLEAEESCLLMIN